MAYSSSSSPEISVAPTAKSQDHFSYKSATHDEVLEDLSSRFILNLPDEELSSLERICFQVEQAHWFYEDFIREENPKFPSLPLKKFSAMLFHACPLLHQWSHDHEQAFNTFMQYKTRVPVCGAIMLNDTWEKCVLVKGWKSSSGWGFPKGKINEHEPSHVCAIREVLEETGYNLAGQVDPEDVIEMSIKEQKISLYIVAGVPEDYPFETKTRKEISKIEWFRLTDLPTWKRNKAAPGKFYLISPFIGALKAFIHERKPRAGLRKAPVKPNHSAVSHVRQAPSRSVQSSGAYHDSLAQESSSQSSSAENGGPYTPSPQYTAAMPYQSPNAQIVTHTEDGAAAMDPNLARLLTSLSMSATVPNQDMKGAKPHPNIGCIPLAPPTPAPIPISPLSIRSREADWSSTVPKPLSQRPTDGTQTPLHTNGSASLGTQPLPDATHILLRPTQLPTFLAISPHMNGGDVSSGPPTPPSAALSATSLAATSVTSTSSSTHPPASQRGSSTADISPYLSRPSAIPTSGKRLKQLALLETVADESARMTPQLGNREPLPHISHNGTLGYQLPTNGRQHFAPTPSASVPPPSNDNDLRVIYSSSHGPAPVQGTPYHPYSRAPPPPIYNDPFQVRPRTSQAMHPSLMHQGHLPAGRASSMHQSQLLSLLAANGPQGPSLPVPPPLQALGRYPSMYGPIPPYPQASQHPIASRGPPMHAAPLNMYCTQGPQAPVAPAFNLPPGPVNSNLLSILNGRPPTASGNPAPFATGAFNAIRYT